MLYVTYLKFGILQRAIINQQRYNQLKEDATLENLTIHPSQYVMDNYYKESKGEKTNQKQILHG